MAKLEEYRFWILAALILVGVLCAGVSVTWGEQGWDAALLNLGTELLGAAALYILFEVFLERLEKREADRRAREVEKARLIGEMGSRVRDVALRAVEEFRQRGWLFERSLMGALLRKASLAGADLSNADLVGVEFGGADLRGVNLQDANLSYASLGDVDLTNANLGNAVLEGVSLGGSNLSGVKGLTEEQLCKVWSMHGVTMPNGTLYNGRFNLEGDLYTAHEWKKVGTSDEAMADFYGVKVEAYQWGQKWNKWIKSPPSPPMMYTEPSQDYKEWLEIKDDPDRDFSQWLIS